MMLVSRASCNMPRARAISHTALSNRAASLLGLRQIAGSWRLQRLAARGGRWQGDALRGERAGWDQPAIKSAAAT